MFWKISIAPVIYKKGNLIALALFTSFFALLFINIYKPLHSPDWFTSPSATFFYSSLLILVIMLTIIVSRVTMWYYSRSNTIPFVNYVIWVICEFFAMSLMYATIAFCLERNSEFSEMLVVALQNSFLIMSLPYIIFHLFVLLMDKTKQVALMKKAEQERIAFGTAKGSNIITFYDDKGALKLTMNKDALLYVESADNYVSIWYVDSESISNYLLRNSLKNIEEQFNGTNIMRCHRAYVVNFDNVKIAKRVKTGTVLIFGYNGIPNIPVSKSYAEKVSSWFLASSE